MTARRTGSPGRCPAAGIETTRRGLLLGVGAAGGAAALGGLDAARANEVAGRAQPFFGTHQAGLTTPRPPFGLVAAFDVLAGSRQDLERLWRTLTERCAFLMEGGPVPVRDPGFPPPDSGLLGPVIEPDALTITVAVGASLFDHRFGLAGLAPAQLQRMTAFPNDAPDPARCHGDFLVQICAGTSLACLHALRDLQKNLPDLLFLRWKQEGSVPPEPAVARPPSARNLLGFRDGSANPDASDRTLMEKMLWVGQGRGEPGWATGGSYQVVRLIRMFVERWDRTPLGEQEAIFGRLRASGAPLAAPDADEFAAFDYGDDPEGRVTPLDSHIRLANPRRPRSAASLILRRPFNYSAGVTASGQLDMGLLFICFQADLEAGFLTVQRRLDGEPLEEYVRPFGGGYFFVLPGVAERGDWLGRTLMEAA